MPKKLAKKSAAKRTKKPRRTVPLQVLPSKCTVPPPEPPLPTSTVVPLEPEFVDQRGGIQNLLHRPLGSAVIITSQPGSFRADHFHLKDWHYCYVVEGTILYFERPVGSTDAPAMTALTAGQMFFTPPGVEHLMYFPKATTFLTFGKLSRTHEAYEQDLTRLTNKLSEHPAVKQATAALEVEKAFAAPETTPTPTLATPTPEPATPPASMQ